MRNFTITLSALLLLQCNLLHAQEALTIEHVTPDSVFLFLDKSHISTGILYDKVIDFSAIEKYDGVFDTVCSLANWRQFFLIFD